jgi:transcriptional regulator with XRE-family HTH domain
MKYSHSSKYRKTCPHDPDTRAQLGFRLRYARLKLGWSIADAGKYFQVTDRTWHNWENGSHRIPYAVYKLLRVLARLELPDKAWAGWRLEGAALITPEGRQIMPKDGAWWSLLVRRAASFKTAYDEATRLKLLLDQYQGSTQHSGMAGGAAAAGPVGEVGGLVPSKTSGNLQQNPSSQNDVIMTSWPILYDFPHSLTPAPEPEPTTSESALTPCSASPWTPTCAHHPSAQRPVKGPHRANQATLNRTQSSDLAQSKAPRLRIPPVSPESSVKPSTRPSKPPEKPCGRLAGAKATKPASASGGAA